MTCVGFDTSRLHDTVALAEAGRAGEVRERALENRQFAVLFPIRAETICRPDGWLRRSMVSGLPATPGVDGML